MNMTSGAPPPEDFRPQEPPRGLPTRAINPSELGDLASRPEDLVMIL